MHAGTLSQFWTHVRQAGFVVQLLRCRCCCHCRCTAAPTATAARVEIEAVPRDRTARTPSRSSCRRSAAAASVQRRVAPIGQRYLLAEALGVDPGRVCGSRTAGTPRVEHEVRARADVEDKQDRWAELRAAGPLDGRWSGGAGVLGAAGRGRTRRRRSPRCSGSRTRASPTGGQERDRRQEREERTHGRWEHHTGDARANFIALAHRRRRERSVSSAQATWPAR